MTDSKDSNDVHVQVCTYLGEQNWLDENQNYALDGRVPSCYNRLTGVEFDEIVEIIVQNQYDLTICPSWIYSPLWVQLVNVVPLDRAVECLRWLYEKRHVPITKSHTRMYDAYLRLRIDAWMYLESIGLRIYADYNFIITTLYCYRFKQEDGHPLIILDAWRTIKVSIVYHVLTRRGPNRANAVQKMAHMIAEAKLDKLREVVARCGLKRYNTLRTIPGPDEELENQIEQVDSEVKALERWLLKLFPAEFVRDTTDYVRLPLQPDECH